MYHVFLLKMTHFKMEANDMPELVNDEEELSGKWVDAICAENETVDEEEDQTDESGTTLCLFCTLSFNDVEQALIHLRQTHNVDFVALKTKFHMDQYDFIKLINCIRLEEVTAEKVANSAIAFWNDDKYLKPGEFEHWLAYDYEELPAPISNDNRDSVHMLQKRLKYYEELLEQAYKDMEKMRGAIQQLLHLDKGIAKDIDTPQSVADKSLCADEGYFSSYAHFGIHHEMLSDVVRTTSYRDALLQNKAYVRGKDVLDVGCGTSILSIFASQAGARKVIGIDNSDIIYNAMDIIKKNNINNVVLVKGRLEDTKLPQQQYDIIISEWMGYFLLFEGMLDSVIYARDHHLKPGGILLPNRCSMSILGYGNELLYRNRVAYWDDVYGLNMCNMRKQVLQEPLIDIVDPNYILTDAHIVADLHLATVDLNYSNFTYNFHLKCTAEGQLSSFVCYFDTFFDLPTQVSFSTGPLATPTHWKQVVFFMDEPKIVHIGEIISGTLTCRRSRSNARSLDISIATEDKIFSYYFD